MPETKTQPETQAQLETQSRNGENKEERPRWIRSEVKHGSAAMGLWRLGSCRSVMGLWRKKENMERQ